MANHDDNTHSLPVFDDIRAAREEDEAVIEAFYEASTDVEDEEVSSKSEKINKYKQTMKIEMKKGAVYPTAQRCPTTNHNHIPFQKISACLCFERHAYKHACVLI